MEVDKDLKQFLEKIMAFANRTGIAYRTGDIYGGLAGFWDYGPIGVEIKNRIKDAWWTEFVRNRDDIVGFEGAIITHPKVWEASGHLSSFTDPLIFCEGKCKKKHRLDHLIEDQLKLSTEHLNLKGMGALILKEGLNCPECGGKLGKPITFNLMFNTQVGPVQDSASTAYLRPENAQLIFSGFRNVVDSTRVKMPFGIAQSGIVFRNEISPRNFLFRVREYELMEFEYFTDPQKTDDCPVFEDVAENSVNIYSRKEQSEKSSTDFNPMTIQEAWDAKIFKNRWQAYWLATFNVWFTEKLGINGKKLRFRQHLESELSHYALDTWDIEYQYKFGWKELLGCANRTQYDLQQHQKHSKAKLHFSETDETGVKRYVPYVVAEPSVGLGRILLTVIADGYQEETVRDRKRVVLRIHPNLAPYDVAVFPLQKKPKILTKAREIFKFLRSQGLAVNFDESGSIGKRYRRHDEVGTPFCITVDFETLEDENVTIRHRDSMTQSRIPIEGLVEELEMLRNNYSAAKII
ncbi:MAG: glycine--tRNA ligase [Candidatus Hodarchaeales archaeon]|jgi:glycyl-tRNA synthetase